MEFPPGLAERSRRCTDTPWETSSEAAERPARPEPTTIALCLVVNMVVLVIDWVEKDVTWRQSIDARAMKREIKMMARSLLRDIESLMKR